MVFNAHAHLITKKLYSDEMWQKVAEQFAKASGMTVEQIYQFFLEPVIWSKCDADGMIEVMDAAGIDKCIVMTTDFGLSSLGEPDWSIKKVNKWVAEEAAKYPERLIPVCALDPRRGDEGLKVVKKAIKKWGMKGVKIYPPCGFYPDEYQYNKLYELCIELGVPLFSHTAALLTKPLESKYADPIYLDSIAARYADLKIVLVHYGGQGLVRRSTELLCCRTEMYAEFSTHQVLYESNPKGWLTLLREALDTYGLFAKGNKIDNKIMFGTDWPYLTGVLDPDPFNYDVLMEGEKAWVDTIKNLVEIGLEHGITFTPAERDKILHQNIEELLNTIPPYEVNLSD